MVTSPTNQQTPSAGGQAGTGAAPSIFDTSANAYNSGVGVTQQALAPGMVPYTMNQYMNPYINNVVDSTMGRLQENQAMDLNNVRGQAAQAGAYGGARQGLVEAELMDRYNRTAAEAAGNLYNTGFNTSAQLGQNRIQQLLQGGQQLVGAAPVGYNMGASATQAQMQAGSQQQALMQQLLSQASNQYDTFANYPQQSLATALAGVQGNPLGTAQTQTSGYNPGLFDYLGFGAGILGGGK